MQWDSFLSANVDVRIDFLTYNILRFRSTIFKIIEILRYTFTPLRLVSLVSISPIPILILHYRYTIPCCAKRISDQSFGSKLRLNMKFLIPIAIYLSTHVVYATRISKGNERDISHLQNVEIATDYLPNDNIVPLRHQIDLIANREPSSKRHDDITYITDHNGTMEAISHRFDISSPLEDTEILDHSLPDALSDITSPVRDLMTVSKYISEGDNYMPCAASTRWRIHAVDTALVGGPEWYVCELMFYSDPACTDFVAKSRQTPKYFASGPGSIKQQASNAFDGDTDTCWPGEWQNDNKKNYYIGYINQELADMNIKCMRLIQGPDNYMDNFKLQYKEDGRWKDQYEIGGIDSSITTFVFDSSPSTCSQSPSSSLSPQTCNLYFHETTGDGIIADPLDQEYGSSVSISGDGQRVAISGSVSNIFGPIQALVEVWRFDGSTWSQLGQTIYTGTVYVRVAAEVELSGDGTTLAFATVYNNDQDVSVGAVTIYTYNVINSQWEPRGNQIAGGVAGNRAGLKVSLNDNGSIIAVGSRFFSSDSGSPDSDHRVGRARVFEYDPMGNIWNQLGSDFIGNTAEDHLGSAIAVALTGLHIAVGATGYDHLENGAIKLNAGLVRVYSFIAPEWVQVGNDIIGEGEGDRSGFSVAITKTPSLTRVAIGAIFNDGNGIDAGHVRVYDYDTSQNIWIQAGSDIDGQNGFIIDENTAYYHVGKPFLRFLFLSSRPSFY